jgi:hypothetical protein
VRMRIHPGGQFSLHEYSSPLLRAEVMNRDVLNLLRIPAEYASPVATEVHLLGTPTGPQPAMYVVRFQNTAQMRSILTFKAQLKHIAPHVFITYDRNERQQSAMKGVLAQIREFMHCHTLPQYSCRVRWTTPTDAVLLGPGGLRQFFVCMPPPPPPPRTAPAPMGAPEPQAFGTPMSVDSRAPMQVSPCPFGIPVAHNQFDILESEYAQK